MYIFKCLCSHVKWTRNMMSPINILENIHLTLEAIIYLRFYFLIEFTESRVSQSTRSTLTLSGIIISDLLIFMRHACLNYTNLNPLKA